MVNRKFGQESFRCIIRSYYQGASGSQLVYCITRQGFCKTYHIYMNSVLHIQIWCCLLIPWQSGIGRFKRSDYIIIDPSDHLGGPVLVPGFCLPKALQPVFPIFNQGLLSGSAELREQAAIGLIEFIEVTSEQALEECSSKPLGH